MDESRKGALRRYHQDLRTGIVVGNILPVLRPVLTDAEYSHIRDREDNISRVDELIDVLLTKENSHFDAFCTALEKNGYEHWAEKLQKQVDGSEGPEVNAPPLFQTQVQFPMIDELADDFAILIVNVKRKLRSLSDSQLQEIKELVEEKLKSKGAPIAIPSSADRLINFISQYWDFLSFEFAQLVVRYLGNEDLQEQLKRYEESLRSKAEILLIQCREKHITPRAPPGCVSMKITVDEDPYSFSLHRILEIKDFLVYRIGVNISLFAGFRLGSIILHFCILGDDMETAVGQLYAHKSELRAMQVVVIEVGNVIVYHDAPNERPPPSMAAVGRKIDDLAVAMETGGPIVCKVPAFGSATFVWPEQPESAKAKGSGLSEEGATDELESQRSLEMQAVKLQASTDELMQQHDLPKISGPESAVLPEELARSLSWLLYTLPNNFKDLESLVDSTFDELERTRAELKCSRGELELSKTKEMATQLKLKSKEEEFSKERKRAGNARQFLEIRVEELEKKRKIESPGQCSKEDVIMQQLAKYFPPIPPSLDIGEKLSFVPYSTFSTVYSGTLEGEPVMVKTISHLTFEATGEMEDLETVVSTFAEEIQTLQALNHSQVLSLKEVFHDKASKQLIVVMERAKESLGSYLKAGQGEMSYQTQFQICSELIHGLLFLYGRSPPIVYGNLNDANVMMTEEGKVKIDIIDSVLKCNPVNMLHLLPEGLRYLPSEAFTRGHTAKEETDVYSLGVLLLQIATQKAPCVEHDGVGLTPEAERRSDDLGELDDQHPLKPIILKCLQHFPRDRPKVALLCSRVQSLIDSEETFVWPEQPESAKAKGSGIFEEGATDELESQRSLEMQAMKLQASTDESVKKNDEPKASGPESAVLPEEFAQSLSWLVDTIPKNFKDLEGIFQSFNEERKDIESTLEASLKAVQSLDELVNGSASLMSLEDYHPAPAPHAMDPGQPTASPSPPTSGGSQRLDDRDTCTTHEQAIVACELDLWKRRFRKLLTRHSQLLHARGMDVDEEMRSLSLSEDEDSMSTSTPSQQEHSLRRAVNAQQEELSCVQEELSREEKYAREKEEMRETLDRTTEEQLLLQNEAKGLTGVKDTDRAYHEIEKKHQFVQTTPEEFPPEHGMAEQEMHDEATGKKLDSLEEEWVKYEATARLVKQLKTDLESLRERASRKIKHHTQESLELRIEKFTTLHGIKQLKSLLEGLKERVAKKPVQKSKSGTHSRHLPSPALEDPSLLSEIESLQNRLAIVTEEVAKEVEQANHARQEMREMKEQLDRTVAEKLQLEKKVMHLLQDWRKLGKCQKVIQHRPGGGGYGGVVVNSEGLLAVTDDDHECVHLLNNEGLLVRSIGEGQLDDVLSDVAFDLKGNIWVTDHKSNKAIKLSQDGQLQQTIRYASSDSDCLSSPFGITVSPEGLIYICDSGNHRVTVHDEEGKFLFTFGSEGSGPGCFNKLRGVACGSDGLLYVTDQSNERVCVWSTQGSFVRCFKTELRPYFAAATSDNHLLVTSRYSDAVMVYTLEGRLIHQFGGRGNDEGRFREPQGICIDNNGLVYVGDCNSKRIQVFA